MNLNKNVELEVSNDQVSTEQDVEILLSNLTLFTEVGISFVKSIE